MFTNQIADLLVRLKGASTLDDLWCETSRYLEWYGITHAIYGFVYPQSPGEMRVWSSLPAYWVDHYLEQRYEQIDPFFMYCCRRFEPFRIGPDFLDDYDYLTEAQRQLVHEASEAGYRSGFTAPVRLNNKFGFGGWNFGSTLRRSELNSMLLEHGDELRLLAFYTHEYADKISPQQGTDAGMGHRPLSAREKDCLLWLSRGYRTAAIADRLGLAPVTVDLHFKRIRQKLGAATREAALAQAIILGLIEP